MEHYPAFSIIILFMISYQLDHFLHILTVKMFRTLSGVRLLGCRIFEAWAVITVIS